MEEDIIGVFIGLKSSTYEYIAELIAPYQTRFRPKIGSFILIDNIDSYIVSRIMDYVPRGELIQPMGEKWLSDVALTPDAIGQDIKKKKICYRVKIKLLGNLTKKDNKFNPGIRELPHITSKVICPSTKIIKQICNQALEDQAKGPKIGTYWMDRNIDIHFNLNDLISKRTFIFARAGYGKSNLMKILASNWDKSNGGIVIFDPEGEYAFTDAKNRPGIMDKKPAILITNRANLSNRPNVYTGLKFNLKNFPPNFVIPILVSEGKHETVFFSKLMSLDQDSWNRLVDHIYENGWGADRDTLRQIIEGPNSQTPLSDFQYILNNMVNPIKKLHDPDSELLDIIYNAVKNGEILIIDISLMDANNALRFSSMIVGYIFENNQRKFTGGTGELLKAVFVVEEAQSVLTGGSSVSRFVELAKEGRKYSLGGIFITQQPGSIPIEILSQSDNFFVFHLLSKADLMVLQKANAHYSDDILTQILSEPIPGKSYMWTSHQPFVLPVRIDDFEKLTEVNKSDEIQRKNDLLGKILYGVNKDNQILINIVEKYKEVSKSYEEEKRQTVELFKKLNDEEKEYCRKKDGIQKNSAGEEFAISFQYLNTIKRKAKMAMPSNEESYSKTASEDNLTFDKF